MLYRACLIIFLVSAACFADARVRSVTIPCANVIALVAEAIPEVSTVPKRPASLSGYRRSEAEFLEDVRRAQADKTETEKGNPTLFADPEIEATVYRVDTRSPAEVSIAGGFFPNPEKMDGGLRAHTVGRVAGTRNYVSCSSEHNEEGIIQNAFFVPQAPDFVVQEGRIVRMTPESWEAMQQKIYPTTHPFDNRSISEEEISPEMPVSLGWVLYEYEIPKVLGTRIIGGEHAGEKEVITRGADLTAHPGIRYRRVVLTAKMQSIIRLPKAGESQIYFSMIIGGDRTRTHVEYSDWNPL